MSHYDPNIHIKPPTMFFVSADGFDNHFDQRYRGATFGSNLTIDPYALPPDGNIASPLLRGDQQVSLHASIGSWLHSD